MRLGIYHSEYGLDSAMNPYYGSSYEDITSQWGDKANEVLVDIVIDDETKAELNKLNGEDMMAGKKCYEICRHDILGRTIYVMADNAEEAKQKAEDYFMDNPLTYDDFVDYSTDCGETDPKNLEPWEILGDEKVMPNPVDAITNNTARVRPHVELVYNWLEDEFKKNGWKMPENPYMAADLFWDVIGKLIIKLKTGETDAKNFIS